MYLLKVRSRFVVVLVLVITACGILSYFPLAIENAVIQISMSSLEQTGMTYNTILLERHNQSLVNGEIETTVVPWRVLAGGVLPIRRFVLTGGREIGRKEASDAYQCNLLCLENQHCHAWHLSKTTCRIYADDSRNPLDAIQAEKNYNSSVIGFMQRNARVLRPVSPAFSLEISDETYHGNHNHIFDKEKNTNISSKKRHFAHDSIHTTTNHSNRILYILHFHHEVIPKALQRLMNEVLPKMWLPFMDLVIITPRTINLHALGIHLHSTTDDEQLSSSSMESLQNPFQCPPAKISNDSHSSNCKRGANGIMSMPIARAKFPGYRGYLLMNDDAMIRSWELNSSIWFDERPWSTFPPGVYSEQDQLKRYKKTRYPYGPYSWSWFNYDSGTAITKDMRTRSNFDAALAALNEICQEQVITNVMSKEAYTEFCIERKNTTLKPFTNGKADALYVPNNVFGSAMIDAITLFGEHDTFMEISYAIIMSMLVPREKMLEMPYCDGFASRLKGQLAFKPYFKLTRNEGKNIHECTLMHPLKMGFDEDFNYWKSIVIKENYNNMLSKWTSAVVGNESFWAPI